MAATVELLLLPGAYILVFSSDTFCPIPDTFCPPIQGEMKNETALPKTPHWVSTRPSLQPVTRNLSHGPLRIRISYGTLPTSSKFLSFFNLL